MSRQPEPRRALVTGCAGFIGSHLSERLLANGWEVVGVDCFTDYYDRGLKDANLAAPAAHDRFTLVEDDLLALPLQDLLPAGVVVYHLAAQAGVRASWGESFAVYTENNIRATQLLLEAARERDVASSCTPRHRRSTATHRRCRCARMRSAGRSRRTA